jgi:DNA-binding CsgD family transcriptional regulator
MVEDARTGVPGLEATVKIVESICALPAVATQNWCDRAAASLLPIARSAAALAMLAEVEENGHISHIEATGVAAAYQAQVTTTVGRAVETSSTVQMDSTDPILSSLRASIAQARDLGWAPGRLQPGIARTGTPVSFGLPSGWRQTSPGRRWEGTGAGALFFGAILLPGSTPGRMLVTEIGVMDMVSSTGEEPAVLSAVLPLLARRALIAIGPSPTDGNQWLTPREQVILQHLLLGKSVREIAAELERSPHTVHDHVKALHRKLNASSRGELVARALGYIQPETNGSERQQQKDVLLPTETK